MDKNKYYYLKKGEEIKEGDEVDMSAKYNDPPKWLKATCIGQPAPDPKYIAHRKYRRLITEETKKLPLSKRCSLYNAEKELPTLAGIPNEVIDEIKQLESELENAKIDKFKMATEIGSLKSELEKVRKENEISYWDGYNDGFGSSENIAPDMLDNLTKKQ